MLQEGEANKTKTFKALQDKLRLRNSVAKTFEMTRCATLKIFLPYKIHVNWDSEVYQCCQKLSDDKGWEVFLKLISA